MYRALRVAYSLVLALFVPIGWCQSQVPFRILNESEVPSGYNFATLSRVKGKDTAAISAETESLAKLTVGSFNGVADGLIMPSEVKIHYRMYQNPKESRGGIVISSGRTEGVALYQELIFDLLVNGYSVYIHDHRGQGFSSRLHDDDRGYVDQFENYVSDLADFVVRVKSAREGMPAPLFMLAHSMGGTIASLYFNNYSDHPFAAAALVTPMMRPSAAGGSEAGNLIEQIQNYCDNKAFEFPLAFRWFSDRLLPGQKLFDEIEKKFDGNGITSSEERLRINWQARASACPPTMLAHCGNPTAKVGGATVRWFNQACSASERAVEQGAAKIKIRTLLVQGGADSVVSSMAQEKFCKNMNSTGLVRCDGVRIEKAAHAVFIESDPIRQLALATILNHFDCVVGARIDCKFPTTP